MVRDMNNKLYFLLTLMKGKWLKLLFVIVVIFLSVICSTIIPIYEGNVLTNIFNLNIESVYSNLKILVIMGMLSFIFTLIGNIVVNKIVQQTMVELKTSLLAKLSKIDYKKFIEKPISEYYTILTNDAEVVASSVQIYLQYIFKMLLTLIMIVIAIIYINIIFIIIPIIMIFGIFIVLKFTKSISFRAFQRKQNAYSKYNEIISDTLNGKNEIEVFDLKKKFTNRFLNIESEFCEADKESEFYTKVATPLLNIITYSLVGIELSMGGVLVVENQISIGILETLYRYTLQLSSPMTGILNMAGSFQNTIVSFNRIYEFMQINEKEIASRCPMKKVDNLIEIINLRYSYKQTEVLHNINLQITEGSKLVIVGKTGSGKTTFVKILYKLLGGYSGDIFYKGINYRDITDEDISNIISVVPQKNWLFRGTILENICYSNPQVNFEEVIVKSKELGIHKYIMNLPNGYQTVIDDSSEISDSIKQMIALLRASVKNYDILILDEATSSMDPNLEVIFNNAIDKCNKNKTVIVITHRSNLMKDGNYVVLFEGGEIIANGLHQELIRNNISYKRMFNM